MPRGIYKNPEERIRKIKEYQAKRWFKEPAQKVCEICNKVFFQSKDERNHQWENKRFCSLVCKGVASRGKKIHTEEHKEELRKEMKGNTRGFVDGKPSPRKGKKANKPAYNKGKKYPERSGENAWNWVKDRTDQQEKHRLRTSVDFIQWRNNIFERDDYTCQKYKIRGGKLHPHHINNFSDNPASRFDVNNGITLSYKAHREFHHIYGVKNNTREQLEEFLKN